MDVNQLHSLFVDAAETDRRLPPAIRKQKMAAWPDVIADWHGYGWTQLGETVIRPTSKQIDEYDKAMGFTVKMPEDDRRSSLGGSARICFQGKRRAVDKAGKNVADGQRWPGCKAPLYGCVSAVAL
jgi:hypothetical protein